MLHFLDRFNPLYPLKHHCEIPNDYYSTTVLYPIMKKFSSYQVNIHKLKQWITLITVEC